MSGQTASQPPFPVCTLTAIVCVLLFFFRAPARQQVAVELYTAPPPAPAAAPPAAPAQPVQVLHVGQAWAAAAAPGAPVAGQQVLQIPSAALGVPVAGWPVVLPATIDVDMILLFRALRRLGAL
jgi:hypothetical protein